MRKILLLLMLVICTCAHSQTRCVNTVSGIANAQEQNLFNDLERATKNTYKLSVNSSTNYIIPVVFHIFHNGGLSNVTESKIINQVTILNKEFQRQQADTVLTPAAFKPFAAAMNIEFRLATKDPNGNCTNGINRIYTSMYACANIDSLPKLSMWPADKYLNIWVYESARINNALANSNGLCLNPGIGTWPWINYMKQGIYLTPYDINNIGSATVKGRRLVHEVGHFLNLRHIWGDINCGNDSVADTPPAVTFNTGCPSFPKNPLNACGSGTMGEMYSNYMDYTSENCQNLFTAGQVSRMLACLNSTVGLRTNLWSGANLISTGTNDPYVYPAACPPVPEILTYTPNIICAGDSLKFTDVSYGGIKTSRQWNFFGNAASSLTDSIVWVKYNVPGVYHVELTTTLGSVSKTGLFFNRVTVLDPSNTFTPPYSNGFETSAEAMHWIKVNHSNDTTWRIFNTTSASGSKCMGLNNFYNNFPLLDELISPAFNLSAYNNITFKFKVHFTVQQAYNNELLNLWYSKNCGKTWTMIYNKPAGTLKTSTVTQTAYHLPSGSSEWRTDSVNFNCDTSFSNVRFRFLFKSDNGNNLFIDDININGYTTTGIQERFSDNTFQLFPNPNNGAFVIQSPSDIKIEISDVFGRILHHQAIGKGTTLLNLQHLSKGLYFVKRCEAKSASTKIIIGE